MNEAGGTATSASADMSHRDDSGDPPAAGPEAPGEGRSRHIGTVVKALIAAGLLLVVLREARLTQVEAALANVKIGYVVGALALNFVGLFIIANRWRVLLRSQGASVRLVTLSQSLLVAMFFNNFLPSTIGGDASRMYDSWRSGIDANTSIAVIVMDRALGLVALLFLALLGAVFLQSTASDLSVLLAPLSVAAAGSALALGLLSSRLKPPMLVRSALSILPGGVRDTIVTALRTFRGQPRAVWTGAALSLLLQFNVVLFYFVLAWSLSIDVPFTAFLLIVPLATLVMMLPISINAIGLREGAFTVLLGLYAVPPAQAIALAWIAYGLVLVLGVLGAVLYAARRSRPRAP